MKRLVFVGLAVIIVCRPTTVRAQTLTAYSVGSNFSAQSRVVELDVPPDFDGVRFVIAWTTENGQSAVFRAARAGRHSYEMRHLPKWQGLIKDVAISLPGVLGRVKEPSFSDEVDMFLEPERLSPATINGLVGHTLFGRSLNVSLFLVLIASALCLAGFKRKPLGLSVVLGFLVSWGIMDLRNIYDHVIIAYKMEKGGQGMLPLTGVKAFADRASDMIGSATWGHGSLDPTMANFLRYRLAEQRYVPAGSDRPPTFWITQDPKDGQILVQYGNYYLVKKGQP